MNVMKQSLEHFNKELRRLHRKLLENERLEAERDLDQRINPFGFLQMLMNDPRFSWLRPLSTFMADLDAFIDESESIEKSDLIRVKGEISKIMIEPKFSERYNHYRNHDSDFAILHANLTKAIESL